MRIASYRTKTVFFYARTLKSGRRNTASVALGRTAGAGVVNILRALRECVYGGAFFFNESQTYGAAGERKFVGRINPAPEGCRGSMVLIFLTPCLRLFVLATAISRFQGVFVYRLLWRAIGKALRPVPQTARGTILKNRLTNCLIEKGKPIVRWGRKGIGTLPEVSLPAERNGLLYRPSFVPCYKGVSNPDAVILSNRKGGENEPLQN